MRLPDEPVDGSSTIISGLTEPGSEVYVGNERIEIGTEGEFEHALRLDRGINVVVVEAVDNAGNIAYESRLVSAKF